MVSKLKYLKSYRIFELREAPEIKFIEKSKKVFATNFIRTICAQFFHPNIIINEQEIINLTQYDEDEDECYMTFGNFEKLCSKLCIDKMENSTVKKYLRK